MKEKQAEVEENQENKEEEEQEQAEEEEEEENEEKEKKEEDDQEYLYTSLVLMSTVMKRKHPNPKEQTREFQMERLNVTSHE